MFSLNSCMGNFNSLLRTDVNLTVKSRAEARKFLLEDEKSIEIKTACMRSQQRFKQILRTRGARINILWSATSRLTFQYF